MTSEDIKKGMIGLAEKETKEQCTENPEVDDKVKADKESERRQSPLKSMKRRMKRKTPSLRL